MCFTEIFGGPQYHGGTNFGRTAAGLFVATSYDYDAPLDEYGMLQNPHNGFQWSYFLVVAYGFSSQ